MNIVVSGWPGAGSSTLALLLAYNLKYKHLRGTETFRLLGQQLGYTLTGEDRIKADTYLEDYWGPVYDKYVDLILTTRDGYLVESDIAAFRLGLKDNIYSIFLAPSLDSRKKRLEADGRPEEISLLEKREKELDDQYNKLHGFHWLDINLVVEKHNLVLDTSNMGISQELEYVYVGLDKAPVNFQEIDKQFWDNGKSFYLEQLQNQGLAFTTEEIIREIVKLFPTEINNMPPELKLIACNI